MYKRLAQPKSINLRTPLGITIMFPPLMSLQDENSAVIKIGAIQVYYYHYYYDLFYFKDVVLFIFHEDLRRKRKTKMPVLCFNT